MNAIVVEAPSVEDAISAPTRTYRGDGVHKGIDPVEWQARLDLAAAYRLAALYGWNDLLGNHFSLRVPGTRDEYLINPFGYFFEEITASSLVRIDTQGNVLSESINGVLPAADLIHGAILRARPDINAVLHLHTVPGTAVSIQRGGLLPISQSALLILDRVRYFDYEGASLLPDECRRLAEALGSEGSILFLRNHGTLAAGRTIGEAFSLLFRIERACQIQLAAQAGGADLVWPEQTHIDETRAHGRKIYGERSWSPGAILEWKAFRRKLDREDPGYAQ